MLGQIVVDDETVFAIVSEVLTHGATRIGGQILKRSGIGSSSRYDNCVRHGTSVSKTLHNLSHGGSLLANSYVNAEQLLLIVLSVVESLLVDNRVNGKSGFTANPHSQLINKQLLKKNIPSLPVANDKFSLSSANGHERIYGLDTGLHGLPDGNTGDDTGGLDTDTSTCLCVERASAVNGVAQGIDNAAEDFVTSGYVDDSTRSFHDVAFHDVSIVTEYDNTDVVGLQVEGHALHTKKNPSNDLLTFFSKITLRPDENSTISSAWMLLRP